MLEGIDVSVWQGGSIDWAAVADARAFAYARAIYGNTDYDKFFQHNWMTMKAAGILRGAYAFFLPDQPGDAQAKALLSIVGDDPGDLPLVCDVETLGVRPTQAVAAAVEAWVDTMLAAAPDRRVMIYGSPGFLNTLPLAAVAAKTLLWTAHYGVPQPMPCRWWPRGWSLWQYGTAMCPGLAQPVDSNRFAGTLDDLLALVRADGPHINVEPADPHVDVLEPAYADEKPPPARDARPKTS